MLWWNGHGGLTAQQSSTCKAVNQTNAALVAYIDLQLNRAQKSLPTIAYYRNHPVELGRALTQISQQREDTAKAFAQISC